ncbi:MAG: hemolysin III family protein [Paludibacteraceae bacterium]|nr:hemolysin III family protein [Paludibacteraceae bacterium]
MFNKRRAEIANSWTHGAGFVAFCVMAVFLLMRGAKHDSFPLNVGLTLFVIGEMLMFFSSTIYHIVTNEKAKRILRYFDHSAIYISIAGSYSPIFLWVIGGTLGMACFIVIWSIALLGILYKIFFLGKFPKFSLGLYLAMGWMVLFVAKPVYDAFPALCLWLLLGEGLSFTLGTYFYWKDKSHTYYHSIWHVFVYLGSLFHYLVLWFLT